MNVGVIFLENILILTAYWFYIVIDANVSYKSRPQDRKHFV